MEIFTKFYQGLTPKGQKEFKIIAAVVIILALFWVFSSDPESKCAKGKAGACIDAAAKYEQADGVARDLDKAKQFLNTACVTGEGPTCREVGEYLLSKKASQRLHSIDSAMKYFNRSINYDKNQCLQISKSLISAAKSDEFKDSDELDEYIAGSARYACYGFEPYNADICFDALDLLADYKSNAFISTQSEYLYEACNKEDKFAHCDKAISKLENLIKAQKPNKIKETDKDGKKLSEQELNRLKKQAEKKALMRQEELKENLNKIYETTCKELDKNCDKAIAGMNVKYSNIAVFEKACDKKNIKACTRLGEFFLNSDSKKAYGLLDDACKAKSAQACSILASSKLSSMRFQDLTKQAATAYEALQLLEETCKLDESVECLNISIRASKYSIINNNKVQLEKINQFAQDAYNKSKKLCQTSSDFELKKSACEAILKAAEQKEFNFEKK